MFFPQKVSVRLHRSGLHGRRGKSNTFDYVQASAGLAPLPMVQYRYIYIVTLCTVCIDLYIGMYRLPGPGGPGPHWAPQPGTAPQPWGTAWAAGRIWQAGLGAVEWCRRTVRCTQQHRAASSWPWPQLLVGWGASPSRDRQVPQPPAPWGSSPGRGIAVRRGRGGPVVVPRWFSGGAAGLGVPTRWSHAGRAPTSARS